MPSRKMDIEDSRNLEMMRNAIFGCNLKRQILKILFTAGMRETQKV